MSVRSDPRRRRPMTWFRLVPAAILALLTLGLFAPHALGQSSDVVDDAGTAGFEAEITAVDGTGSTVEVALIGPPSTVGLSAVSIAVDGEEVDVGGVSSSEAENRPTELVIVVDTNVRSAPGDVLSTIKERLSAEVEALPSETAVGIVSAGDSALVVGALTTDTEQVLGAIGELSAKNGSALFNAIDRAATMFSSDPTVVKSLLILSTGVDNSSDIGLAEAQVGVVGKGAQIISVAYQGGEPQLATAVSDTAGMGLTIASAADVSDSVTRAMAMARTRLLVSFVEPEGTGARAGVVMTVDGATVDFSYPTGVLTASSIQLAAVAEGLELDLAFFNSSAGLYLALGLAFVGITLGVWSLGSILVGGEATLEGMLARYAEGSADEDQDDAEAEELIVQSALLQRAVSLSESFAEKRGFLARLEELLERANLPVRAGEAMFILAAITVLSSAFGLVVTRSIIAAVLFGVFAAGVSFFVVRLLGRRRFKTFESQLPDTLQLLSGTLRAGYSLPQGLEAVSKEMADPMGGELRRAMTEAQLGRDLEDCLDGVAERLSSADFAWAVMAIGIQREVGGNLNELLMSVADTMIARERLKREIGALTAEGKVSAAVLSFLPPGLGVVMWVMNPGYVGLLFSEVLGNIMLGLGVVSALVGLAWMKKVITVDV